MHCSTFKSQVGSYGGEADRLTGAFQLIGHRLAKTINFAIDSIIVVPVCSERVAAPS